MKMTRRSTVAACLALAGVLGSVTTTAYAASAEQLTLDGKRALDKLYATQPKSRLFAQHAKAVLVFPSIIKGGFVVGAQTGNGVLLSRGRAIGFYNISAASFGLQAGGQAFSYALFFMKNSALSYLEKSAGWSVGTGPNVVVVDKGAAVDADSTTLSQDVYAFPFAAKGLMAGIDIKGSKITKINPK